MRSDPLHQDAPTDPRFPQARLDWSTAFAQLVHLAALFPLTTVVVVLTSWLLRPAFPFLSGVTLGLLGWLLVIAAVLVRSVYGAWLRWSSRAWVALPLARPLLFAAALPISASLGVLAIVLNGMVAPAIGQAVLGGLQAWPEYSPIDPLEVVRMQVLRERGLS